MQAYFMKDKRCKINFSKANPVTQQDKGLIKQRRDKEYEPYERFYLPVQGGPERMQHLRSLISKKPWTKSN